MHLLVRVGPIAVSHLWDLQVGLIRIVLHYDQHTAADLDSNAMD